MKHELREKNLQTLLSLYNLEIDTLKEKLLNGESWENLQIQRRNVTELAIAIHKSCNQSFSRSAIPGHPAEFPNSGNSAGEPAT